MSNKDLSQDDAGVAGCCEIDFQGGANFISNITRAQCAQQAAEFPGATFQFTPGQACPDQDDDADAGDA